MADAEEYVDVVNENDEAIGKATRKEAHKKKHLHRAVHIVVFNSKGEVFVQKRGKKVGTLPGYLEISCAGHVDSGETYLDAAHREMKEELGFDMPLQYVEKIQGCKETGYEFVEIFACLYDGTLNLNTEEVDSGLFQDPAAIIEDFILERKEYTPNSKLCFRECLEKKTCGEIFI
jgi:isopentenyl-diphosphate Delta-isomerase